jgi:hypothetical protein
MNNNIEHGDKVVQDTAPLESSRPAWERMPRESVRAYAVASLYFKMGPRRSHEAVAKTLGKRPSQMQRWSKSFEWVPRAMKYDDHLAKIEQDAIETERREYATKWHRRVEEHCEKKFQSGLRFEDKAAQMLAFPLAKVITEDGKTTVLPGRWNTKDAVAFMVAGSKMKEEAMEEVIGKEAVECQENWMIDDYTPVAEKKNEE